MDILNIWLTKDQIEMLAKNKQITLEEENNLGCDICGEGVDFKIQINPA